MIRPTNLPGFDPFSGQRDVGRGSPLKGLSPFPLLAGLAGPLRLAR
jgi:hypothetical protein